jgi:hypothetical protein
MKGRLPAVVRLEEVSGIPTVMVIQELGIVVADLKALVAHAKAPDGKPRNARLLLTASDRIRACLETAMRIQQAMHDVAQVDRLHDAILEEVGREKPAVGIASYAGSPAWRRGTARDVHHEPKRS